MRFLVILIAILLIASQAFAISQSGFVAQVMTERGMARELQGEVVIPFDSEYKIQLSNHNNSRVVAKVSIDGISISNLGDFVLPPNGEITLERFLDRSLTEGKRFKFVRVNHPEVQDPYSRENGIVRVEFRKEKRFIPVFDGMKDYPPCPDYFPYTDTQGDVKLTIERSFTTNDTGISLSNFSVSTTTSASPGATIAGSISNQRFQKVEMELEDEVTFLMLKILGI